MQASSAAKSLDQAASGPELLASLPESGMNASSHLEELLITGLERRSYEMPLSTAELRRSSHFKEHTQKGTVILKGSLKAE